MERIRKGRVESMTSMVAQKKFIFGIINHNINVATVAGVGSTDLIAWAMAKKRSQKNSSRLTA